MQLEGKIGRSRFQLVIARTAVTLIRPRKARSQTRSRTYRTACCPSKVSERNAGNSEKAIEQWKRIETQNPAYLALVAERIQAGGFNDTSQALQMLAPGLTVLPKNGALGQNQVPAALEHVIDRPSGVRLEFANEIAVEMARPEFEKHERPKEWVVQFPPESLKVV